MFKIICVTVVALMLVGSTYQLPAAQGGSGSAQGGFGGGVQTGGGAGSGGGSGSADAGGDAGFGFSAGAYGGAGAS